MTPLQRAERAAAHMYFELQTHRDVAIDIMMREFRALEAEVRVERYSAFDRAFTKAMIEASLE